MIQNNKLTQMEKTWNTQRSLFFPGIFTCYTRRHFLFALPRYVVIISWGQLTGEPAIQ